MTSKSIATTPTAEHIQQCVEAEPLRNIKPDNCWTPNWRKDWLKGPGDDSPHYTLYKHVFDTEGNLPASDANQEAPGALRLCLNVETRKIEIIATAFNGTSVCLGKFDECNVAQAARRLSYSIQEYSAPPLSRARRELSEYGTSNHNAQAALAIMTIMKARSSQGQLKIVSNFRSREENAAYERPSA